MAPNAALKRQTGDVSALPAKRTRHGEDTMKLRAITAGFKQVEGMPRDVAKLLGDMLEVSLVPVEDRHDLQKRVVAIGDEALRGHESKIQAKIAGAAESIARSEEMLAPQQQVTEQAEGVVTEKSGSEQCRKRALAENARVFRTSKRAVAEAEEACNALDDELKVALSGKGHLETILSQMVLPLTEGNLGEEERKNAISALVNDLESLDMPSSIMVAIPASFGKAPEQRGSFDTMVVNQLREEIAHRIGAATSQLEQAELERATRDAARAAAQSALDAAKASQLDGAQGLWASQAETKTAQEDLEAKQLALYDLQREQKIQRRALSQAEAKLESFRSGVLATFASLRDRKRQEELMVEEEASAEGTAAAGDANAGTLTV